MQIPTNILFSNLILSFISINYQIQQQMIAAAQIANNLYEQILSLHEFVDPNISKQFYLERLSSFKQLPLLLEDMLFMFTNVSSKVRQLVENIKPRRVTTVEKSEETVDIQNSFPTQIQTDSDVKKKLTVTSLGFGENNILRERSLNIKPVRRQKLSQQIIRHLQQLKQNKEGRQLKKFKELPQLHDFPMVKEAPNLQSSSVNNRNYLITEEGRISSQCDNQDPYSDQQIYLQNPNLGTKRDKRKQNTRKRRILSICVKGQNSPNLFID